jgi:hypothetical protein
MTVVFVGLASIRVGDEAAAATRQQVDLTRLPRGGPARSATC